MFTPLPNDFMLRYPFIKFTFIYSHNLKLALSGDLGGFIPELDIIKDNLNEHVT